MTHTKIFSALISMALLAMVVYGVALFGIGRTHAAEPLIFGNVAIADDTLTPLTAMPAPVLPGAPDTGGPLDSNVQVQALPVNIDTADDLKLYIQSLEQEDADLIDIKVEKDSIVFSYREQARFLGSLSMSVLATVKVNDAGVVSLRYPWYTSSSAIDDDKLKDELQTDVSRVIGNGNLSDLSIRSRAEMLLALDTVLKAHTMSEVK